MKFSETPSEFYETHSILSPPQCRTVTFCTHDSPASLGGPFTWLRRLLPLLRSRGVDCRCLFLTHFGETGPVLEGLRQDGFQCTVVNCHAKTIDQVRWILERLHENPPDIFVPNLVVSAYYAARWVRSVGIPTVGVLHSDDPFYRAIQDEFVCGPTTQQLSSIICVSRELELQVRLRKPPRTNVCRIPYGVAVPDACVEPVPSRFRIAYVGRLAEEQKRISELTRAFIRVCRNIPNAEAVIYGDGPDRGNVEAILAAEGQHVSVRLAGNIPNDEIQNELLHCDVITLLSDYEGLPISLLEAMACGCVPVCLTMRSGIPELIDDNVSGLIVSNREESFQTAIRRLHDDVALRTKLSQNAKHRIAREFSERAAADMWAKQLLTMKSIRTKARITIPRRISLPPRNPAIESEYQRPTSPSSIVRFFRRGRMMAGKLRRRLF